MKTREELAREREGGGQRQRRETSVIGMGGAILLILAAIGIYLFVTARPDKPPATLATGVGTGIMSNSTQCERLVEIYQRDGVVKGERVGNHIRVDEARWTHLPSDQQRNLLQYVACAAFSGRSLDALDDGEEVVVIDAGSGKPVARAGRPGLEAEGSARHPSASASLADPGAQ